MLISKESISTSIEPGIMSISEACFRKRPTRSNILASIHRRRIVSILGARFEVREASRQASRISRGRVFCSKNEAKRIMHNSYSMHINDFSVQPATKSQHKIVASSGRRFPQRPTSPAESHIISVKVFLIMGLFPTAEQKEYVTRWSLCWGLSVKGFRV